jgi:diadenosine tetraphosphate (Ap4A) HIT family hydrolase
MHATLTKFGYPGSVVTQLPHWTIVLRPQQITLGSLVLVSNTEASSFAALPADAYTELGAATKLIETGLAQFRPFDRINYIMLMMVDPHVHFHVLPRYQASQDYHGMTFSDASWPGPPDFKSGIVPAEPVTQELLSDLRKVMRADNH